MKNQTINLVVNQASKTPRAIETVASTRPSETSAGAGCPQYDVLIKDQERPLTISRVLVRPCPWEL